MGGWSASELVRQFGFTGTINSGPVWTSCRPSYRTALPAQGWKLHISSRATSVPELLERVVPCLEEFRVAFKVAATSEILRALNDGSLNPAAVGKALTIYPDPAMFADVAAGLVAVTRGHAGPRVLSDRKVASGSPVYYRYGPFQANWRTDEQGLPTLSIDAPNGEVIDGIAGLSYQQPPGAVDPLGRPAHDDRSSVLGGRYRVIKGVRQSPRGDVLLAMDEATNQEVILKQARSWVSEYEENIDTRTRLRNELRILTRLVSVSRVPRALDHFSHGTDEYLALTKAPGINGFDAIRRLPRTRFAAECTVSAQAPTLTREILEAVRDVHGHGVQIRDVSPQNVVIDVDHDEVTLIDFGLSGAEDLYFRGGTPGFAQPSTVGTVLAGDFSADGFALARLLLFLASGIQPQTVDEDDGWAADAYVTQIRWGGLPLPEIQVAIGNDRHHAKALHHTVEASVLDDADNIAQGIERILEWWHSDHTDQHAERDASLFTGRAGLAWGLSSAVHHGQTDPDDLKRVVEQVADLARNVRTDSAGLMLGLGGLRVLDAKLRHHGQQGLPRGILDQRAEDQFGTDEVTDNDLDLMYGRVGGIIAEGTVAALEGRRISRPAVGLLHTLARRSGELQVQVIAGYTESSGVSETMGAAHGWAGYVEALAIAVLHGEDSLHPALVEHTQRLIESGQKMLAAMRTEYSMQMSASWCRGAAGISRILAGAACALDSPHAANLARDLSDAAIDWIPWLDNPSVCCGALGIGFSALEVRRMVGTGSASQKDPREALSRFLVLRRRAKDSVLVFPDHVMSRWSWALGQIGVLEWHLNHSDDTAMLFPSALTQLASNSPCRQVEE